MLGSTGSMSLNVHSVMPRIANTLVIDIALTELPKQLATIVFAWNDFSIAFSSGVVCSIGKSAHEYNSF